MSWRNVASMNPDMDGLCLGTSMNGMIYALCEENTTFDNEVYDPTVDAWGPIARFPVGDNSHTVVTAAGGMLYAIGGPGTGQTVINRVDTYSTAVTLYTFQKN